MLVFSSTYESMKNRALTAEISFYSLLSKHNKLIEEWNDLVTFVKKHGGRKGILQKIKEQRTDLSKEDIQRLLQLCHPDKHDGKQMATDMTAKLLKIKEQVK